jgi:hypothetical protein
MVFSNDGARPVGITIHPLDPSAAEGIRWKESIEASIPSDMKGD